MKEAEFCKWAKNDKRLVYPESKDGKDFSKYGAKVDKEFYDNKPSKCYMLDGKYLENAPFIQEYDEDAADEARERVIKGFKERFKKKIDDENKRYNKILKEKKEEHIQETCDLFEKEWELLKGYKREEQIMLMKENLSEILRRFI